MMNSKKEAILEMVLKYLTQTETDKPLTVSNLAQDLDIGKSTIYEYFDDKESLIIEAIGRLVEKNVAALVEDDISSMKFEEAFKSHLHRLYHLAKDHEMLQSYTYHYEIAKLPQKQKHLLYKKIYATIDTAQNRLEVILKKGVDEGVIEPLHHPTRLQTIKALIFGGLASICDPYNDWDADELLDDVFESIVILHR